MSSYSNTGNHYNESITEAVKMLKKSFISITVVIFISLLSSCAPPTTKSMMDVTNKYSPISTDDTGKDISLMPIDRKYYLDEKTNKLVYFMKNDDSDLYNLIFVPDDQEKENILSLPTIPMSYIIDDGYIYFYSRNEANSISPNIDSNYKDKQDKLKKLSKYFGDNSHGNLFRANLETKEIQWLGSSSTYLLDDKYIYFMEAPLDLDQYGMTGSKGCVVTDNSLCRMEKDGTDPILISSEVYGLDYVTDKYIYTNNFRFDKVSLSAEALPDLDIILTNYFQ